MKAKTTYEADTNEGLTTNEIRQILNRNGGLDTKVYIDGKPVLKVEYDSIAGTFNFII